MSNEIKEIMEQSQTKQPIEACCIDCQWYSYEDELIEGKCPVCGSNNIQIDCKENKETIEEYYKKNNISNVSGVGIFKP